MKILSWLLKAAIFFTLFAFALNNQQDAAVHFFFGTQWRAPMVLIVLTAFAAGLFVGVLGMVPRWWKHRKAARQAHRAGQAAASDEPVNPGDSSPGKKSATHVDSSTKRAADSATIMPPYALPLDDDSQDAKYPHGV
jgi:putative membrane protein